MVAASRLVRRKSRALAGEGTAPTQEECAYLLGLPADSAEACAVRGAADGIMRQRTGTPFEGTGEITAYQLSLIAAVQCLAHVGVEPLPWIGHHEPTPICYASGSNLITAETGVNPRDTAADTSTHRGMDLTDCRTMLYEAGFTHLCKGDGTLVELTEEYIREHIH